MKKKPTTTYAEVVEQIEALQAQAASLKKAEVADVIARIREAITVYGLTAQDLGLGSMRGRAAAKAVRGTRRKKGAAGKTSSTPKFRDEAGNVWGGRGPRPLWLREALASGKKLEDFAV